MMENATPVADWQRSLYEHVAELCASAEAWRLPDSEARGAIEEGQWIDPSFPYALPHARVVLDLADRLEAVADDLSDVSEPPPEMRA